MEHTAPLYHSLIRHAGEKNLSFHMPVHTPDGPLAEAYGTQILSLDTTELDGTDNLAHPGSCIARAHWAAAAAYGCSFAHFLVGGSTSGVHAMLLYACRRGDTVLVDRCAHVSVLNACAMYGINPVFLDRETLPGLQISAPLTAQQVEDAIRRHPAAKAVLVTSPTYYGVNSDLRAIADAVHRHSLLLLCDAAHGSHYAFCPSFPESAVAAGTDLCTVSLHKTLGALTQTALLLADGPAASDKRLKVILNMVQTTSPSYLLMSSADLALCDMCAHGEKLLSGAAHLVETAISRLEASTAFRCLPASSVSCDPLRLTINCSRYQVTGDALARALLDGYGIEVEMADLGHIVCIIGPYVIEDDLVRLEQALEKIARTLSPIGASTPLLPQLPPLVMRLSPAEAFAAPAKYLPLDECVGRVAASNLCVYPPGVPVAVCGCEMTVQICDYLAAYLARGGKVPGLGPQVTLPVLT